MGGHSSKLSENDEKKNDNKSNEDDKVPQSADSVEPKKNEKDAIEQARQLSVDSIQAVPNSVSNFLSAVGYELQQQIGDGGFSKVYLGINSRLPGVKIACKVFNLDVNINRWAEKFLKSEIRIMANVRHKNIVPCYDCYKSRTKAYIVMYYAENGSIASYLSKTKGRIREEQCLKWFHGLMSGIRYLHKNNIAHRDLKLDNFLLNEKLEPLISDFGFSVFSNDRHAELMIMSKTICGTSLYLAPEVRKARPDELYDAKKADIYSMGICLYELLHGFKPFEGDYDIRSTALIYRQMNRDFKISRRLKISGQCHNLIHSMLDPDPNKRPTAKQVLSHPWFKNMSKKTP